MCNLENLWSTLDNLTLIATGIVRNIYLQYFSFVYSLATVIWENAAGEILNRFTSNYLLISK
jgi:hypothetical protein